METNKDCLQPPVGRMNVDIKLLHPDAKIPTKAHATDNGYDIYAVSVEYDEEMDCYIYHTGIAIKVPIGYSLDVIPKSRHRKTYTYMPNTPGDVDPGYTGEILVNYKPRLPKYFRLAITHIIDYIWGHMYVPIDATTLKSKLYLEGVPPYGAGEAVAQCYLTPHPDIVFNKVDHLPETERGNGGHGSTITNNH